MVDPVVFKVVLNGFHAALPPSFCLQDFINCIWYWFGLGMPNPFNTSIKKLTVSFTVEGTDPLKYEEVEGDVPLEDDLEAASTVPSVDSAP